jgi:UDP-N-acetylglucosamine 2-epimerase (non-hydrolysing)
VNVLCVLASRANVIKAKPVVDALERHGQQVELVSVGFDPAGALRSLCAEVGLRLPDAHLEVGAGSEAVRMAKAMIVFERHLHAAHADWVLVIDHAAAALGCALVATKAGARVAHLEAGLRSHDWSRDDEIHRTSIDRVSDLLLVPSPDGVNNLRVEGFEEWQIQLVGNTLVDTLRGSLDRVRTASTLDRLGLEAGGYALIALSGDRADGEVADAVAKIGQQVPVVTATDNDITDHAIWQVRHDGDEWPDNGEPCGYLDRQALIASARLVVTDVGDVQDETTAYGVGCLTLAPSTDRPATIVHGTNRLVGPTASSIIEGAVELLTDHPEPRCPLLWDGNAADRVATALARADVHGGRRRSDPVIRLG